jgi:tetratricopeptide (TPR) repeat protein
VLDRAIADYDKAIALSPNFAPAYYERAQAHYLAGRFRDALVDATKAAELNANWAQAISLRGLIQEKLGARDAAIADLRRAAALDPALQQPADALRRLGVMR